MFCVQLIESNIRSTIEALLERRNSIGTDIDTILTLSGAIDGHFYDASSDEELDSDTDSDVMFYLS